MCSILTAAWMNECFLETKHCLTLKWDNP